MNRFIKLSAALGLVVILGGCAAGLKHPYDSASPDIKASAGSKLSIGVQDKRIYVLSKQKSEDFVGLTRGGFGEPFDTNTASGKPLADDINKSILSALNAKGVQANAVSLPLGTNEGEAMARLAAAGNKAVLITFSEWKSDTMYTASLHYDVQAMVVDGKGQLLASKRIAGTDNLSFGNPGMNLREHVRSAAPAAFRKKLEELFAAPEIARHL